MPDSFIYFMIACPLFGIISMGHMKIISDKIIFHCYDKSKAEQLFWKMLFQPSKRKEYLKQLESMCTEKELFKNLFKWFGIYQGVGIILIICLILIP